MVGYFIVDEGESLQHALEVHANGGFKSIADALQEVSETPGFVIIAVDGLSVNIVYRG